MRKHVEESVATGVAAGRDVHGLGLGEPVPAPRQPLRWRR